MVAFGALQSPATNNKEASERAVPGYRLVDAIENPDLFARVIDGVHELAAIGSEGSPPTGIQRRARQHLAQFAHRVLAAGLGIDGHQLVSVAAGLVYGLPIGRPGDCAGSAERAVRFPSGLTVVLPAGPVCPLRSRFGVHAQSVGGRQRGRPRSGPAAFPPGDRHQSRSRSGEDREAKYRQHSKGARTAVNVRTPLTDYFAAGLAAASFANNLLAWRSPPVASLAVWAGVRSAEHTS